LGRTQYTDAPVKDRGVLAIEPVRLELRRTAMRRGNPEYDPDDNGRWKAMADDPDHVEYDATDSLRTSFTLICKKCASKRVVVCEDQVENTLSIFIVCEECGHHAYVSSMDMDE
jgi:DNA-directed RNA polymerase subunit M/transcription elongation factor TFIIS